MFGALFVGNAESKCIVTAALLLTLAPQSAVPLPADSSAGKWLRYEVRSPTGAFLGFELKGARVGCVENVQPAVSVSVDWAMYDPFGMSVYYRFGVVHFFFPKVRSDS